MPEPLTARQTEVYDFFVAYIAENGLPPTVREVADHFAIASTEGVMCHLRALERKGWLERRTEGTAARNWRPIAQDALGQLGRLWQQADDGERRAFLATLEADDCFTEFISTTAGICEG